MQEIQVVISNKECVEVVSKLNDKIILNNKIKESSYEDSYFDTYLQNFKQKNIEVILRTNEKTSKLLVFKIDSVNNIRTLLNEKIISRDVDKDVLKEEFLELFKLFNIGMKRNMSTIEYSKIATIRVFSSEYEIFDKNNNKYKMKLNKVEYLDLCQEEYELVIESSLDKNINFIFQEFLDSLSINYKNINKKTKLKRYFHKLKNVSKNGEKSISNQRSIKEYNIDDFIVVVEGKSDERALRRVYKDLNIYLTYGLGLTDKRIYELKELANHNNKKILILTDPDTPGEMIRKRITSIIPEAYNKYIYKDSKKNKKNKKQIGVESLDDTEIKKIFKDLKQINSIKGTYTMEDLINFGIYANKEKRAEFCKKHCISYGNNKKVLKQLNDYNIKI